VQIVTFSPDVSLLASVQPCWPVGVLADEVGVYAASPDFVRARCGPAANAILDAVPADWFDRCAELGMLPNIDVRTHRLNPGEFPAVPGWHCDGALRETYFAQPDRARVPIRDTLLCVVSSHEDGIANPEFVTEPVTLSIPTPEEMEAAGGRFVLWREVHRAMPADLATARLADGQLTQMSCDTLHRVMPAHQRGIRLLFRMSMWHNPHLGDGGKVAVVQQRYRLIDTETVWLEDEANGW
jgi:hypothetical protein